MKQRNSILLGVLLGIGIVLALFFGYRRILEPKYQISNYEVKNDLGNDSLKLSLGGKFLEINTDLTGMAEKISATNKRLDDMLIFGGIIITLLLAINVSVYVRAEGEVEKHFKQNLETYRTQAIKYVSEIEKMTAIAKAESQFIQQLRKKTTISKTPT